MKNNFLAGFILIGTGLLFGLPHLLIPIILGGNKYSPLGGGEGMQSAIVTEEVYTYVPEVREILEGRFPIRDTQLSEYKKASSPFVGETLPAVIMALLSRPTGSVEGAFMAADFLFPPMAVWLIYRLSRGLGIGRPLALLTGAATVITTRLIELVPYPWPVWDYLVNLKGSDDFLFFSRNFHPQLSFLLFGGMLMTVNMAIKTGGQKRMALAGVLVGAQFYTYFFSWTSTIATLIILLLWQTTEKNWVIVRRLTVLSLMGFIFSLPYVWEMFQFRASPLYQNFFLKNSLASRSFISMSTRYAMFVLATFWLTRKKRNSLLTVLIAASAAVILLPEAANLFLGRDPEGKHWIRRLLMPLAFPLAAVILNEVYLRQNWFKLKKRQASILALIGLGAIFLFGIRVQISASQRYIQWFHRPADKQELFDWFNLNGKDGEAAATLDSGLIAEIPAFTKLNNAVPITTRSIATTDETLERFLETAGLYRLAADDVRYLLWSGGISVGDPFRVQELGQLLPDSKGSWVSRIFYFTADNEGQIFSLSPEKREAAVSEYRQGIGRKYRVDYILVGPIERKLLGGDALAERYEKVFENGSYLIYKLTAEK